MRAIEIFNLDTYAKAFFFFKREKLRILLKLDMREKNPLIRPSKVMKLLLYPVLTCILYLIQ